ncbi:MAG: hypothetical protein KatS3mg054_1374 [Chloroflexus sp.]|nr:MAG: hypothetical protein KatS3mg054_1374 [Chloroflexus sp.]
MGLNDAVKEKVLKIIANGKPLTKAINKGREKWKIADKIIHVRFRTSPKTDGFSYSYNISPNTLEADYEVWICGSSHHFYLIPMFEIRAIYNDPEAYVDYQHPNLRVAEVNTINHRVLYGRNRKTMDFSRYFKAKLQL